MRAQKKTPEQELQLVIFKLGNDSYAVGIKSVRDVIKLVEFVNLPNAPGYMAGVINLRGHIICTIDLRKKFNLKAENTGKSRIMIVMIKNTPVGIIVDEVEEVITIKKKDIDLTPSIIDQHLPGHCLVGIAKYQDKLIILININNLLSPDELRNLKITNKT
ncbi:MAG: purine-binding chemotaxis protein CheW [Candidatus Aureabacteria bacterium]|nr:purine-binding chemotaxis protein CheW [Candidatus Auribacterota bacterium]